MADEMGRWLRAPLRAALGDRYGEFELSFLSRADAVTDGTTILLLRDTDGKPRAVVLCSAPTAPSMVERSMKRARRAKKTLGTDLGDQILVPLLEGNAMGLSYAVLPFCKSLSKYRLIRRFQCWQLQQPVFDWLWRANEHTLLDVEPDSLDRNFAEPLRRITALKPALSDRLLAAAERAGERLLAGKWKPRHVLMHGDFWTGNILIRSADDTCGQKTWRDRFVIIDWPDSETRGYAMFDLIRMAQSMRLHPRHLRNEVSRHCRLLQCELADATSYLLAALGHIFMNLENFPVDRFTLMADSCYEALVRIQN